MMMRKRAGQDEVLVILKDLYKDFAVIMDMYFYAAEVARIIYYLTGDPAWERNWDRPTRQMGVYFGRPGKGWSQITGR